MPSKPEHRLAAALAITRILSESPVLVDVVGRVLLTINETLQWKVGAFWIPSDEGTELRCLTISTADSKNYLKFRDMTQQGRFAIQAGLPGRVWQNLEPVWIPDVTRDKNFPRAKIAASEGLHAAFAFPVVAGGRFLGVMEFFSSDIRKPDKALLAMFSAIGIQIGQFIERRGFERAMVSRANEQAALYEFTNKLYHATSLTEVYDSALDSIIQALHCDRASLLLFDDSHVMRFVGWRGLSPEYRQAVEGHSPWTPEEKDPQPICINDIEQAAIPDSLKAVVIGEGIYGLAFIPLMVDGKLLGKFMTYYNRPHDFEKGEIDLALTIGRQLAFAVDRKHKEEALLQNEERLRLALETGKVGVWDWDIRANRISWTDSLYTIFGIEKADFDGTLESSKQLIHPDDREGVLNTLERSLQWKAPLELEYRSVKPDGQIIWLSTNSVTICQENGRVVRMLGATIDITDLKESEHKLRNNERQLRDLIEALPAAVYTTDAQGRITMFNQAAVEFAGRIPNLGEQWCVSWKLFWPDGTVLDHEECPMAQAIKTGMPQRGYEAISERPDGTRVNFIPYPTPLFDHNGTMIGAVNMLIDITQRKHAEQKLKKINQELKELTINLEARVEERTQQLNEQSEQLRRLAVELTQAEESERKRLAQILHDHLQQLLVAAKMRLDMMERKSLSGHSDEMRELRSYIEQAYDSSRTLTAELRPPVLYEGGLAPALRFLSRKFEDQYSLKVYLELSPAGEPESNFLKVMIYQSVQEMLFNAVKYAGVSECSVYLSKLRNGHIQVVVFDQGRGFDPQKIGRKGSPGFGLFSIRERVKAMGGQCLIESSVGKGSRFTITIPEDLVTEELLEPVKMEKPKGALNILLADDHKIVRQSLAQLLAVQPFINEVVEAEDGQDVLRKAKEASPDIIIMDLNLPKMNGIEATRHLRHINPRIKIIGLSVQTEQETVQAMLEEGAVAYFHKGEETDVLLEALEKFAQVNQRQNPLGEILEMNT